MELSREEQNIINVANQIEVMMQTPGWKYFKSVWNSTVVQTLGGIDENGNMHLGQVFDKGDPMQYRYLQGYGDALVDLQKNGIHNYIQARQDIHQKLKEDQEHQSQKINHYQPKDEIPNL